MFEKVKNDSGFGSPLIDAPDIQELVTTLELGCLGTGQKVAELHE